MRMLFVAVAVIMGAVGVICGRDLVDYKFVLLLCLVAIIVLQTAYMAGIVTHR